MRLYRYLIILVVGFLLFIGSIIGCSDNKSRKVFNTPSEVSVRYSGYEDGCKAVYDPFYCSDKYRPANYKEFILNSDKPQGVLKVGKKTYTLTPEQTEKILETLGKK